MKRLLFYTALLCTIILGISSAPSTANSANTSKKERAVTKFSQPVQLMGIRLNGQYLFVHDDEAMMRGDACTYVYEGAAEIPTKLVIAFNCLPVARAKAAQFTVRTLMTWPGRYELTEFQFGGSTKAHLVIRITDHIDQRPTTARRSATEQEQRLSRIRATRAGADGTAPAAYVDHRRTAGARLRKLSAQR